MSGLIGVTFSQFDNKYGTQLVSSFPDTVMQKEDFENLSDYAIVGKHLCGKIISVKTSDIQFLNYSIAIENPKYERNTLLFSFGFILALDVETEPYERVLRKFSSTFVSLELEREFLFKENTRSMINALLKQLYEGLRDGGEAFLEIDASNFLAVKLFNSPSQPRNVRDCDVPMLCVDGSILSNLPWDISIRHILKYIDGISTVKHIATHIAAMDLDVVKRALKTLAHYDCVIFSDIVRFSNVYEILPEGRSMLQQKHLIDEMCRFSAVEPMHIDGDTLNSFSTEVVLFLSRLQCGKALSEIIIDHKSNRGTCLAGVNIRRLLAFAQHRGVARRVHEFPVHTSGQRICVRRPAGPQHLPRHPSSCIRRNPSPPAIPAVAPGLPNPQPHIRDRDRDKDRERDRDRDRGEWARQDKGGQTATVGTGDSATLLSVGPSTASLAPGGSAPIAGGGSVANLQGQGQQQGGERGGVPSKKFLTHAHPHVLSRAVEEGTCERWIDLDGEECLDALCCSLELPPSAILGLAGVVVIYK